MKNVIFLFILIFSISVKAQMPDPGEPSKSSTFQVVRPDYKMSPFTGMTRKHWKDADLFLLNVSFSYIHHLDDPMKFPKQPGKSYPRTESQVPTEQLEGLCRTLFIAAPLLKEDSNLTINHIRIADYYRYQLNRLSDSTSPSYIRHRTKNGGPSQTLVEFGGLSVSLFAIPEIIWDPLTKEQKDALAATMLSYGNGPTIGNNWKFFNIFILSFFKDKGYGINEKLLVDYVERTLQHYSGDGWYHDAPAYDYYSMWAFQMYGPLWAHFFGEKYYPDYAKQFQENFKPLKNNYPYTFSRNGEMIMWGRSMSYRFASTIPLALTGLQQDPSTNFGWMRRIASGALLQFLKNPNMLSEGIPTLGFYGAFEPTVQSYSCRGSVYWMGKAFLSLLLPEQNPYWAAKENEGPWKDQFRKGQVYNKFEDSANLLITNYPNIGASEVRVWCHVKAIGAGESFRSSENYNRLSYNSAFPWQADSMEGVVSMNYIFKNKSGAWEPFRLYTFRKYEQGIYYRDAVLETDSNIKFNLADIPLANGILRIDKSNSSEAIDMKLGHYALPEINGPVKKETRTVKGYPVQIINNGIYQLAMIPLKGWTTMHTFHAKGVHPASKESEVINVEDFFAPENGRFVYATLMLWKKAGEKWTDDELIPVRNITEKENTLIVQMLNGDKKVVQYNR